MVSHEVPRTRSALRRGLFAAACLAGVAITTGPAAAQAQDPGGFTTANLARICGPAAADANAEAVRPVCHAVLVAVGQTHAIFTSGRQATSPAFCLPTPSPSLDTVASAFVSWSAANPQFAGTRAAEGVMRFAAATYPCTAPARRR